MTLTPTPTQPPAKCDIGGKKFNDMNGDGRFNTSDTFEGVTNWSFSLYEGDGAIGNPITTTTTAANTWKGWPNSFKFTNLTCGKKYTIKEERKIGWEPSGDVHDGIQNGQVTFTANDCLEGFSFGNKQKTPTVQPTPTDMFSCDIGGRKFNDLNGDGRYDAGDTVDTVNGWVFYLYNGTDVGANPVAVRTTENGSWKGWNNSFRFSDLKCGNIYTIREEIRDGWIPSGDTQNGIRNGQVTFKASNFQSGFSFGNREIPENLPTGSPVPTKVPSPVPTGTNKCQQFSGAIFTTDGSGTPVNGNIYYRKDSVFLQGGAEQNGAHVPDNTYYYKVTNPSGDTDLFADGYRTVTVTGNVFPPVSLSPFDFTPNNKYEYKVWLSLSPDFQPNCSKTDNFKVYPGGDVIAVRTPTPMITVQPVHQNKPGFLRRLMRLFWR